MICCLQSDEAPWMGAITMGLSPPSDPCPHVGRSSQVSVSVDWIWSTALQSGSIPTNGDKLIKPVVWHLYTLFYFKISVWSGLMTPPLNSVSVFELRRLVWKFWPKYMGYYQVTAIHSQRVLQRSSSCYCSPTGIESPLLSCLLIRCFHQCSSQSKGGKKKLTKLHRNIAFFPRVEAKQTEV